MSDGATFDVSGRQIAGPTPRTELTPSPTPTAPTIPQATVPMAAEPTPSSQALQDYQKALSVYTGLMAPSQDYANARQRYLDYVNSLEQGITALSGQGRGIPLSLVRGMQGKLQQQGETTAKRLQAEMQTAQQEQQAKAQAAQTQLGFAEKMFNLASQREQTQATQALARQRELGINTRFYKRPGNPTVFDTVTNMPVPYETYKRLGGQGDPNVPGSFNDVTEVNPPRPELKTLSAGATLYNPQTGEIVYRAPSARTGGGGGASGGGGDNIPLKNKANIERYIKEVVSQTGITDENRYELWDLIANEIDNEGYMTSGQVNDLLWKYFHPEGIAGYKKYVLGQTGGMGLPALPGE